LCTARTGEDLKRLHFLVVVITKPHPQDGALWNAIDDVPFDLVAKNLPGASDLSGYPSRACDLGPIETVARFPSSMKRAT
jgi:hypothetical protein